MIHIDNFCVIQRIFVLKENKIAGRSVIICILSIIN